MFSILPTEAWNVRKFSPWLIIRVEELTSWLLCRTNSVLGCEFTSMRIRFVGVISLGFVQISYESKPEWEWHNKTSLNMMYLMCLHSLIWIDKLHLRSCSVLSYENQEMWLQITYVKSLHCVCSIKGSLLSNRASTTLHSNTMNFNLKHCLCHDGFYKRDFPLRSLFASSDKCT